MKQVDAFIITSTRAPGKTRKAWYQYILVCNGHTVQKKERVLDTTGHRMVLECAIAALKRMNQPAMITIHTDCHYFADGQRRLAAWKNNGRKRTEKSGSVAGNRGIAAPSCSAVPYRKYGAL